MSTYTIAPIKETIAAGEGYEFAEQIPVKGRLQKVILHYPPGCASLVNVAVGINPTGGDGVPKKWLVPSFEGKYISLDDATVVFSPGEPVDRGYQLWTIILNTDTTYSHTISVIGEVEIDEEVKTIMPFN